MHQRSPERFTSRWQSWALFLLLTAVALLPWWRNRGYLRSFFDYGVVMGGIGRMDAGQRPYVDFITPIQTGWYHLNGLAEKLGGGTYQGMTWAGAVSTMLAAAVLFWMLAWRWTPGVAAAVAGALVCATTAQHTILWYNPWGVVWLSVAAWAGAVAPVLRRKDWIWHVLAGAALFLGGINKINMQLMALMFAWAWAVRAGLNGVAGWGRVGVTLFYYAACAGAAVLAEMAWTGASFATWWHNVIALPAASRSGTVLAAWSADFLLKPLHDYYGPLLLKPVGLVGVVATILTVIAIMRKTWREPGRLEKVLPLGCGLAALLGGVVLLTTNMDIAYIGLGGWLALLAALWMGYGLPARGGWFQCAVVLPMVLVGAVSWLSAWAGQRSQFGHSSAARSAYVRGEQVDPDFGYLRGTLLPPEMADSLRYMAEWRRRLPPERRARILYGPGTEMAARFWPALKTPGLPIYLHAGNSMGSAEEERFFRLLRSDAISEILVSRVLDLWSGRARVIFEHRYDKNTLGGVFFVYSRIPPGVSLSPVWFTRLFGGNADSRVLVSDAEFLPLSDWRMMLGITEGTAEMRLIVPTNRLQGEVVLRRQKDAPRVPVAVEFAVYAQANESARFERWRQKVELAADQDMLIVPTGLLDSSHMPATFTLEIPPELSGLVTAGWRGPQIMHTGAEGPEQPDWFFRGPGTVTVLDEAALAKLLPADWRPAAAWMRNGRVTESGIELSAGGEIWLQVRDLVRDFAGTAKAVSASADDPRTLPMVRGMWYRGGRLEVYSDQLVRAEDMVADFHAWCAEPGGWLVIGVDPSVTASPVMVRVHKTPQP